MDTREACERRAWRLATLLSGDSERAERIVAQALDAQPDPTLLPDARLDRLVILRAREQLGAPGRPRRAVRWMPDPGALLERLRASHRVGRGAAIPAPTVATVAEAPDRLFHGEAARAHDALRAVTEQPREAWILHELDGKEMIEISRAMDCSKTAAARHLEQARERMAFLLGDGFEDAVRALRRAADELDPGEFIVRRLAVKQRGRRLRLTLALSLLVIIIVVAISIWGRFG